MVWRYLHSLVPSVCSISALTLSLLTHSLMVDNKSLACSGVAAIAVKLLQIGGVATIAKHVCVDFVAQVWEIQLFSKDVRADAQPFQIDTNYFSLMSLNNMCNSATEGMQERRQEL
jgi:hypothetical protein